MPLHPDKLVGATRAIHSRPVRPRPTIAVAAARAASQNGIKYLKGKSKVAPEPGLIENLAFRLQAQHEERHLERVARRADQAVGKKLTKSAPSKPSVGQAQPTAITIQVTPPEPPKGKGPGAIRFL